MINVGSQRDRAISQVEEKDLDLSQSRNLQLPHDATGHHEGNEEIEAHTITKSGYSCPFPYCDCLFALLVNTQLNRIVHVSGHPV